MLKKIWLWSINARKHNHTEFQISRGSGSDVLSSQGMRPPWEKGNPVLYGAQNFLKLKIFSMTYLAS